MELLKHALCERILECSRNNVSQSMINIIDLVTENPMFLASKI